MMASKCRKFVPNIFNKSKCQDCFAAKDLHSAEALENNKASRKICKCGYLFVSPDFDFTNPLDRTRRWQRRFFILYDDGELSFSVDENPDTIPQGVIDMNRCQDVTSAEKITSHDFSIAVSTPEKTHYIKGNGKDEITRWADVLVMYPRSNIKTKSRRAGNIHNSSAEKENQELSGLSQTDLLKPGTDYNLVNLSASAPSTLRKPLETSTVDNTRSSSADRIIIPIQPKNEMLSGPGSIDKGKQRGNSVPHITYRGVRSLKHKFDKAYQEGLRKSSSMYDLSEPSSDAPHLSASLSTGIVGSRFLSRSRDGLDGLDRVTDRTASSAYGALTRTLASREIHSASPDLQTPLVSSSVTSQKVDSDFKQPIPPYNSQSLTGTRLHSIKNMHVETVKQSPALRQPTLGRQDSQDATSSNGFLTSADNETDEHKTARNRRSAATASVLSAMRLEPKRHCQCSHCSLHGCNRRKGTRDIRQGGSRMASRGGGQAEAGKAEDQNGYMKKGWLLKQSAEDSEWQKYWFVLSGDSLRYYKDVRKEDVPEGRIDLSTCSEVTDFACSRNYGLRIKNQNGEYSLAAMTTGIRSNWVRALRRCLEINQSSSSSISSTSSSMSPYLMTDRSLIDSSAGGSVVAASTAPSTSTIGDAAAAASGATTIPADMACQGSALPAHGRRLDISKPARRHYSDLSLRYVGDMSATGEISITTDAGAGANASQSLTPREQRQMRRHNRRSLTNDDHRLVSLQAFEAEQKAKEHDRAKKSPNLTLDFLRSSLIPIQTDRTGGSVHHLPHQHEPPLRRYVEGSDNVSSADATDRLQHAKSPSARLKDKSRAKSPRLHSPPPETDDGTATISDTSPHSTHRSSRQTGSSERNGIVDLLETEVETLKHHLETTQHELTDLYTTNLELKSQLVMTTNKDCASPQPVHSSTPTSPEDSMCSLEFVSSAAEQHAVHSVQKQLRHSQDLVHRYKSEIDTLRVKLDMTVSKLNRAEDDLTKSVNDLKQEKEKFLRLSDDWNARIKTLEDQLQETCALLDHKKEELSSKERRNKQLENELRNKQEKQRESEREILKLKAVERDYKRTKEQLDNTEIELSDTKSKIRDYESKLKKLEDEYEKQLDEMEHSYREERDEMEQHVDELQAQLIQRQQQTVVVDTANSNMQQNLHEKDEIITQLEEKLIETDARMEEVCKVLKSAQVQHEETQHALVNTMSENKSLHYRLGQIEQATDVKDGELTATMDMKSNSITTDDTSSHLFHELKDLKVKNQTLEDDNNMLQSSLDKVHSQAIQLERLCSEKTEHLSSLLNSSGTERYVELGQKCDFIQAELMQIKSKLEQCETFITTHPAVAGQKAESPQVDKTLQNIHHMSSLIINLQGQFKKIQDALNTLRFDVNSSTDGTEYNHNVKVTMASGTKEVLEEYMILKSKFDRAVNEIKLLKKEMKDAEEKYDELELKEKCLKENLRSIETDYKSQLALMSRRVDDLTNKLGIASKSLLKQQPYEKSPEHAKNLSSQLTSLEQSIEQAEESFKVQDSETSSLYQHLGMVEDAVSQQKTKEMMASPLSNESAKLVHHVWPGSDMSDSESAGTSRSPLSTKLKQMKAQLESTNVKMRDIASKMDHNANQRDVKVLKEKEVKPKEQIVQHENKLAELMPADSTTTVANTSFIGDHLHNVESKLNQSETTIENCRKKLADIINQVETYQSSGEKTLTPDTLDVLKKRLSDVMEIAGSPSDPVSSSNTDHVTIDHDVMSTIEDKRSSMYVNLKRRESELLKQSSLTEEQKMQLYAEKLSCEAVILSELAYILQRDIILGSSMSQMQHIHKINGQMFQLEQKLGVSDGHSGNVQDHDSEMLGCYASLLADKIISEGQLTALANPSSLYQAPSTNSSYLSDPAQASVWAHEVLLRSDLEDSISKCHKAKATSVDSIESCGCLLATKALMQGELTFAMKHMKRKLATRLTEQERTLLTEKQLASAMENMKSRHKKLSDNIDHYKDQTICHLASVLSTALYSNVSSHDNPTQACCNAAVNLVENEMKALVKYSIPKYEQELGRMVQESSPELKSVIEEELRATLSQFRVKCDEFMQANELQPPVHPASPADDVSAVKAQVSEFAEIVIQYSLIGLSISHFSNNNGQASPPLSEESSITQDAAYRALSSALTKESEVKDHAALELRAKASSSLGFAAMLGHEESLASYADILVREALFQAELSYTILKQKVKHKQEMTELREFYEFRNDNSSEDVMSSAYSEYEVTLAHHEMILESEHKDLLEALHSIEADIQKLKTISRASSFSSDTAFLEQIDTLQSGIVRIVSELDEQRTRNSEELKREMNNARLKLVEVLDGFERDKETLVVDYEDRIVQLEEEIDIQREEHESEFTQLKNDMVTAVSAIKASEVQSENDMGNEIMRLRHQISAQRAKVMMELRSMRSSIPHSQRETKLAVALLGKIQNIEHILTGFKSSSQESLTELGHQDFSASSSEEESDDETSDASETAEDGMLKQQPVIPASSKRKRMETRAHKRILLRMHERHKTQMEQLRRDKEHALEDEMRSTKAALEAMRKKYEEELENEREKFTEALHSMHSENDMTELISRHNLEVLHMKDEVSQLSKKNKKQLEDVHALEQKLHKHEESNKKELKHIAHKQEQSFTNLNKELERIRTIVMSREAAKTSISGTKVLPTKHEELSLKLKDTEIRQLREQIKLSRERLQRGDETQDQIKSQYNELYHKYEALHTEHEEEVERLKRKLENAFLGNRTEVTSSGSLRRGLKRVASFNQRDRSPSPPNVDGVSVMPPLPHGSSRTSRDGQRSRRHIHPRDLHRSKSSPSVPTLSKTSSLSAIGKQISVGGIGGGNSNNNVPSVFSAITSPVSRFSKKSSETSSH